MDQNVLDLLDWNLLERGLPVETSSLNILINEIKTAAKKDKNSRLNLTVIEIGPRREKLLRAFAVCSELNLWLASGSPAKTDAQADLCLLWICQKISFWHRCSVSKSVR